jgi:hypothetical protein
LQRAHLGQCAEVLVKGRYAHPGHCGEFLHAQKL